MPRLKNGSFTVETLSLNALLERRGYTVTEDHQGLWAAKVPLKALTLRSKKAVTAKPTDEQRLKGSLLAKRYKPAATLSTSEHRGEDFIVQQVEPEKFMSQMPIPDETGGISC